MSDEEAQKVQLENELGMLARGLRSLGYALQILNTWTGEVSEVPPWDFFTPLKVALEVLSKPGPASEPQPEPNIPPEQLN
jgi:hypothetical protein